MTLLKNKLATALALAFVSASAFAAPINCTVTPVHSIITEGQTLKLQADCNGALTSINWSMDGASVTGDVSLASHAAGVPVYYTTPVGLGGSNAFDFTVTGVPASGTDNFAGATTARVFVKPSSAVITKAATTTSTPTASTNGLCGSVSGSTVSTLPSNGSLCQTGKPSLIITGPSTMTWSCLGYSGGLEANCYVTKGVTYTIAVNNLNPSGGTYTINPTSGQVGSGGTVTVTAQPGGSNVATISGCGGTQSGNTFTIASVTQTCTVSLNFSTQPVAINGACGSSSGQTFSSPPTTNLCSSGTASSVLTGTSSYTWNCNGSNGGANASCSATIAVASAPPPTSGGNDPGTGSWWASTTRLIAGQTGTAADTLSYLPGCLNGATTTSGSSGCALNASNEGFSFVAGNVMGIRYVAKANAGSTVRYHRISSGYGGAVGSGLKAWLSADPLATYENTPSACRNLAGSTLLVPTGPGYCTIVPGARYYLFLRDDAGDASRYIVDETSADFL